MVDGERSRVRTDAARERAGLFSVPVREDVVRLINGFGGVSVTEVGMEEKRDSVQDDRSS